MWVEKHRAVWRIREVIDGKKTTLESGFTTKTSAKNRMTTLKADQIAGRFIDPRSAQETLESVARRWWSKHARTLGVETVRSEGARLENHVIPLLGAFPIGEVNDRVIELWITELGDPEDEDRKPLAPKTIRNVHGVLHSVLQYAVDTRIIGHNWCSVSKLPKVHRREMRFLTKEQIGRLIQLMPLFWRPLILFLVSTGARFGEAIAVKQNVFSAAAGTVRIERGLHELSGRGLVETVPKTKWSMRTVGLPRVLVQMMVALCAELDRSDDYIFRSTRGHAIRYSAFLRMWYRAIADTEFEGLRIHDLRHTHAAQMIAANRPLTAIQRRLGHSSITVTSDLYGHLLPEVDEGMIAAVEASIGEVDFAAWERELTGSDEVHAGGIGGETILTQPFSTLHNTAQQTKNPRSEPISGSQPGASLCGRRELNPRQRPS